MIIRKGRLVARMIGPDVDVMKGRSRNVLEKDING